MKNYLLQVLLICWIIIEISLGGTALGIVLKSKKSASNSLTSVSFTDQEGGFLALVGGFKSQLNTEERKLFFKNFNFDENSGKNQHDAQPNANLAHTQVFSGAKITLAFIRSLLKKPNAFTITKKILLQCDIFFFSIKIEFNLASDEVVLFNKSKKQLFLIFMWSLNGYDNFKFALRPVRDGNYFVKQAGGSIENLLKPLITPDNKADFLDVFYAKSGGVAQSDGSDFQYALAINQKTGALYFITKTKVKSYVTKIIYLQLRCEM